MHYIYCSFAALLSLCGMSYGFEAVKRKVENFDVKPGGMVQTFKIHEKGVQCKFTYACQGGTNEQWEFGLLSSEDGTEYSCYVARPSGTSYLFFQQFAFEVRGFEIKEVNAESQGGNYLSPDEYVMDAEINTVLHVDGKFNSQLARLEVMGVRTKQEL